MLKIKISIPNCPPTNIIDDNGKNSISKFLPEGKNIYNGCEFYVNEDIEEADYWFVIDNINLDEEKVRVAEDKIYFLSAEVPFVTNYFDDQNFLEQFAKIYSPHAIYHHNDTESTLPFLPFMIDAKYGETIFKDSEEFNYDKLLKNNSIKKTKNLSIIASNKGSNVHNMTEFHKARYYFAKKLKEHFKDRIDLSMMIPGSHFIGFNPARNPSQSSKMQLNCPKSCWKHKKYTDTIL